MDITYLPDMKKRARLRCLHLLERRDYTEKQLVDKLRLGKTPYPPEVIEDAIAYVKSYHYIDDARYCQCYVEQNQNAKSRWQMEQELRKRGISQEDLEDAFAKAGPVAEGDLIRKWLEKRHYAGPEADAMEKQRMYAFLRRRGFSSEEIRTAMGGGF